MSGEACRSFGNGTEMRQRLAICGAGLLFCLPMPGSSAHAQTITIRMVNGDTGKPLGNKNVGVMFRRDDPGLPPGRQHEPVTVAGDRLMIDVFLDKKGIGKVDVPPAAKMMEVIPAPHDGDAREYTKRSWFSACRVKPGQLLPKDPRFPALESLVPVNQVLANGFLPTTDCMPKLQVQVHPGEYVILAKPESCFPLCGWVF